MCYISKTRAKWFDIPLKGETICMTEIAESVYIERFSKQVYDESSDEYFLTDSSDEESCRKGSDSDQKVDVPDLKSKSMDDEHLEEALCRLIKVENKERRLILILLLTFKLFSFVTSKLYFKFIKNDKTK